MPVHNAQKHVARQRPLPSAPKPADLSDKRVVERKIVVLEKTRVVPEGCNLSETSPRTGNILGELTAEADGRMLSTAFYESRNYRELVRGNDFRFVVGRRGAGKSALFKKVAESVEKEPGIKLLKERPAEEKVVAFQRELDQLSKQYLDIRTITRLTWKAQILTEALEKLLDHYKAAKLEQHSWLHEYRERHKELFDHDGIARSLHALRMVRRAYPGSDAGTLPERIADFFAINKLRERVTTALQQLNLRVVFLYDGLDEGWIPTQLATGLLGGLAKAAAEFREDAHAIHCLLFIRDNMLRALAQFDGDYTRNIEGNTLRLHWDEQSLLHLVAMRLRSAFDWRGENDLKAWNRFAQRGLEGLDGFRKCLQLTLYRPRDVIALLNGAYQEACRADRERLIDEDLEGTATRISRNRLSDLHKEYEHVLPGLPDFAEAFRGKPARGTYANVVSLLDDIVAQGHAGEGARDFALLRTGSDAFNALFSVGFLGLQDDAAASVRFCHDGSNTDVQHIAATRQVVIHPCYWRALDITSEQTQEVLVRVDDEDDLVSTTLIKTEMQDMRLRQLGQIVEELHSLPEGPTGAGAFEKWVLNTTRYLFAKGLDNIQLHPNPGAIQQRDIIGTVVGDSGFWRRLDRYGVKQFIIEAKNYQELDQDEFRQAWGYLSGPYGSLLMIVTRSKEDGVTERERALIKEGYDRHEKMVLLMPAKLLQRALSKMRSGSEKREDYTQDLLNKRLDLFERSYTDLRITRKTK